MRAPSPAGARPSKYGLFPSLLPLPFAAAVWPLRRALSSESLDAAVSLTRAVGAGLSALAFLSLARRLKPSASPLWGPAFLAGTFLWPYAAESFVEPWAAAALAHLAAGEAVHLSPNDPAARALYGLTSPGPAR